MVHSWLRSGTVHGRQNTFSGVSRLPLQGFSRKFTSISHHTCAENVNFVAINYLPRASYVQNTLHFRYYLKLHWKDSLKFALITFHYKRSKFGCQWPIIKDTLFQEQCDFVYNSPSIGRIFLKLQTSHFTRMYVCINYIYGWICYPWLCTRILKVLN